MMVSAKHRSARGGWNGLFRSSARPSDSPAMSVVLGVSARVGVRGGIKRAKLSRHSSGQCPQMLASHVPIAMTSAPTGTSSPQDC
jgi:hypothetical protein